MKKIFIYYNNGLFEATDNINMTLLHMIEKGVIKIIVNTKDGKAWIRNDEGIATDVKIPEVSGL